ncbi:MAG: ABC transporter permease [Clostridioides sp.]|nr:ABC transporter permease [Clostridioides sp.]
MFKNTRLIEYIPTIIVPAIWVTLKIMLFSAVISIICGLILGTVLYITEKNGLKPNKYIYFILDKITDIIRSFPVLILIVSIMPLTKIIMGTTIGPNAAIFAISVYCTPFAIKMTQNSFNVVNKDVIKAAKSCGASKKQIIFKVVFVEALPHLVANMTILIINMLNTTAIAGAIGSGGLGAVALAYGYQRFDDAIMYFVVAILLVFVIFIQGLGNILYKVLK